MMINKLFLSIVSISAMILLFNACIQDTTQKLTIKADEPVSITPLQNKFHKAKFNADGQKILFIDQQENTLNIYELESETISLLVEEKNSIQDAYFSADGQKVYYISTDYSQKKRTSNLYELDVHSGSKKTLKNNIRNLRVTHIDNNTLVCFQDGEVEAYAISNRGLSRNFKIPAIVFTDQNLNLSLYENGKTRIINPGGDGKYLWPAVSPDQRRVLYSISGKETYISDLDGKNVVSLGRLHAPKWSPDGQWIIGMDDYDDGQRFTKSNIIMVSKNGKERHNLTLKSDVIALYPEFSPRGDQIVFNDEKGRIYLMKIR